MIKDKRTLTKTSRVLLCLLAAQSAIGSLRQRGTLRYAAAPELAKYFREQRLQRTIRRLEKQGWITQELKETHRIYKLTAQGELEALLAKITLAEPPQSWDGKWRLLMFDIPEGARDLRRQLRLTLRNMNFYCLQASIYISPWPISNEAIHLLKSSKLMRYIRLARADFDDDTDLRRIFNIRT